jgi:hypothetical protein
MDGTGCAPSDVAVRWAAGREQGSIECGRRMSVVMAAEQGGLQWGSHRARGGSRVVY